MDSSERDGRDGSDELNRLRELVGADEAAYAELCADLDRAAEDARRREIEVGELRQRVVSLEHELERQARRDRRRYVWHHRVRRVPRVVRRLVTTGRLRATSS